jgi:hypothetical protein
VLCHGSVAGPSTPSWVLVLQCRGLSCLAGPLTGVMPATRALSRQRGRAQHPFWVLVLQCSCTAGPLAAVARALSRQRGRAQHPFLGGAGATVQRTQLHGWSPHWCDARCSCFVTAAWLGPAPFLGAGATVQGTQLHGWSPHWCDARCSCFVTAAWQGPAPLPGGCWCYSAGDSAAWLVPSLV